MNIQVIDKIRNKYHSGFDRDTSDINEIVIHGTGGGSSAINLINWMLNSGRAEEYKKGIALFHYLIDFNGDVFEIINPIRWVYHSSSGKHDMNTIGIEIMNKSANNDDEPTGEQYGALLDLISNNLMKKFNIKNIVGHGSNKQKYSGEYKACPGKNFKWNILQNELIARGYTFSYDKERITNIGMVE
jgi:N-acetyl-anhydromuramyl-L-alanine amidase AmpD